MLNIIAFILATVVIALLINEKIEQIMPVTLGAGLLILWIIAMIGHLEWIDTISAIVIGSSLMTCIWMWVKRKPSLKGAMHSITNNLLTPGIVCFLVLCFLFVYVCQVMVVFWHDDYVYWALEVKSLEIFHGLTGIENHLAPFYATYTPGASLIEWFAMHCHGEFSEPVLFQTLFICYVIYLLPLFRNISWKRFYLIPVVIVFLLIIPAWGNSTCYANLSVDTLLALCFGWLLTEIYQMRVPSTAQLLKIFIGLSSLVLIKQIGVLLAMLAIILMIVLNKRNKIPAWKIMLCAGVPILTEGIWLLFCKMKGLSGYHTNNIFNYFTQMLSGSYVMPEGGEGVLSAMWQGLFKPYSGWMVRNKQPFIILPKFVLLVLTCVIPAIMFAMRREKETGKLALFNGICIISAFIMLFVSFYTVFYDETIQYTGKHSDEMTLLLERYLSPILFGTSMLFISVLIEKLNRLKKKRLVTFIASVIGTVFLMTTANIPCMGEYLIPDRYIQYDSALGTTAEVMLLHDWAEPLVEEQPDAVVLCDLGNNASYTEKLSYVFAPVHFVSASKSQAKTPERLKEYIQAKDVTHLISFGDVSYLYKAAVQLTLDGDMPQWTLYSVCTDEDDDIYIEEY